MKKADSKDGTTPSQLITNQIAELADWRGQMLTRLRKLILGAAPGITEEWKWDTAVWSQNSMFISSAKETNQYADTCQRYVRDESLE